MGWVRQRQPNSHRCPTPNNKSFPDGKYDDLWRCDYCSTLWRVGYICDHCDVFGKRRHPGCYAVGLKWRRATKLQQLLYRNK